MAKELSKKSYDVWYFGTLMKGLRDVTGVVLSGGGDVLNMVMPSVGSVHRGAKRDWDGLLAEGGGGDRSVSSFGSRLTAEGEAS